MAATSEATLIEITPDCDRDKQTDDFKNAGNNDSVHDPLNGQENEVKRSTSKEESQTKILCVLFSLVNIIMLGLIVILSYNISKESETPEPVAEFCFQRSLFENHPYDRQEITFCDETRCCFDNLNSTGQMIKPMIRHWLKNKIANDPENKYVRYECDNDKNTDAADTTVKLVARRKRSTEPCDKENILWDCDSDIDILPSSDKYLQPHNTTGEIEIRESGLYHVYSQINVLYYKNSTLSSTENFRHLVVSNMKNRNEDVLMRNSNSQCDCENNDKQLFSSYLGSDFLFDAGVKLAVRVFEQKPMEIDPESSFFGVIRL